MNTVAGRTTRFFTTLLMIGAGLVLLPRMVSALVFDPPAPEVQSVSANSVTITWKTDVDADAKVTVDDGANPPITRSISTLTKTHTVIVDTLRSAAAYTFIATSSDGTNTATGVCPGPDGCKFTTPSAAGDVLPPVLISPFANTVCGSTNCTTTIGFQSNEGARAEVMWGTTAPSNGPLVTAGFPSIFSTSISPLPHATDYVYTIRLQDASGNWRLYGPFSFTTCSVGTLLCFQIGQCEDGTALNECNREGFYCNGGSLEQNCTACGFECKVNATCKSGGACIDDPVVTDNTYQCNPTSCYDSNDEFVSPAGAGCFKSWPKCNSNVVLKVRNDRTCKRWIDCTSAIEVKDPTTKAVQQLCTNLGNCAQIDLATGKCSRFLPNGQCELNPGRSCSNNENCAAFDEGDCILPGTAGAPLALTYTAAKNLADIRYLTGAIKPGFVWTDGSVSGLYPWALAKEAGSSVNALNNNEFESIEETYTYDAQGVPVTKKQYATAPWFAVGGRIGDEEVSQDSSGSNTKILVDKETPQDLNNPNHVLWVYPNKNTFAGARSPVSGFFATDAENYRITLRIKATDIAAQTVAVQLMNPDAVGEKYPPSAREVVNLTTGWQNVSFNANGISGRTFLQVVNVIGGTCRSGTTACIENNDCDVGVICDKPALSELNTNPFLIDDVYIQPVLAAGKQESDFIARSCRLYPRGDSLSCAYEDQNGLRYQGWTGFCLERDPGNSSQCVSWWPVDLIGSDTAALGSFGGEVKSGYDGRKPLYMCLESSGNAYRAKSILGTPKQCSYTGVPCTDARAATDCPTILFGDTNTCSDSGACEKTYEACAGDAGCPISIAQTCVPAVLSATDWWNKTAYVTGYPHGWSTVHSSCDRWSNVAGYTFSVCNKAEQTRFDIPENSPEYGLKEWEIESVEVPCGGNYCHENQGFAFAGDWKDTKVIWSVSSEQQFTRFVEENEDGWKNPRAGEPVTLNKGEIVWSFAPSGNKEAFTCGDGTNCIQFNLIFSPTKGLIAYRVAHRDNKGDNEGGGYDVKFHVLEYCKKLVKVVDDSGNSKAWTQRASKNSAYSVPGLSYGYTSDFSPFGGVVTPAGSPETWDGDAFVDGQQPLYTDAPQTNDSSLTTGSPYQARSGSPYACTKDCSAKVCIAAGSRTGVFCNKATDCVGEDVNGGTLVGRCTGVGTCEFTAKACITGLECPTRPGTNQKERCIGGLASDKGGQAFSEGQKAICSKSGRYCSKTEAKMCYTKIKIFGTEYEIPTGQICTDSPCNIGDTCKTIGLAGGDAFCDIGVTADTCVLTGASTSNDKFAVYRIQRLFAESYGAWQWNSISQKYDRLNGDVLWKPPASICNARFCSQNSGLACGADAHCPFGTTCNINRTPAVRPSTFNSLAPTADYCGIPPRVFNALVDGDITTIAESNDLVKLTFNSTADPNQLPLEAILIDWGDEQHQGLSFPYAPKDDKDSPHVFLHAYICTETTPTYVAGKCTFKPKVLVRDNWGFCNNYWNDPTHNVDLVCNPNFDAAQATWAPNANATEPDGKPQKEITVTVNVEKN